MNIEFEQRGDVAVAIIEGSVDGLTAGNLEDALGTQVADGHLQLVADLAACDYTSSAGLRALLATVKTVRSQGGDLRLARPSTDVLKVLELSGFTSIMKLYPDLDDAVASYAKD